MSTKAPDGSRWYLFGRHWTAVGATTRDGQPAVRLKPDGATTKWGKRGIATLLSVLDKHGSRTDEGEGGSSSSSPQGGESSPSYDEQRRATTSNDEQKAL